MTILKINTLFRVVEDTNLIGLFLSRFGIFKLKQIKAFSFVFILCYIR